MGRISMKTARALNEKDLKSKIQETKSELAEFVETLREYVKEL